MLIHKFYHGRSYAQKFALCRRFKSTYTSTVNLPRTSFPQRVEGEKRINLDHRIVTSENFQSVYHDQFKNRTASNAKAFTLHDGPPYANGDPHLGHAVNKILKDITNRWKMIQGYRVYYRPGWDCHGLPIELKARQLQSSKNATENALDIRKMARDFATKEVEIQKKEFMSWGVMGDWDNPYITMSPEYVKNQLKVFLKLYESGTLFQRYMPVYWSPSSKSALAESELEYDKNHRSKSIYVRFPVSSAPTFINRLGFPNPKLYLLVWTTTPWTLVANKAICVKRDAKYCVARTGDEFYIVARELCSKNEDISEIFREKNLEILPIEVSGHDLTNIRYKHPLSEYLDNPSAEYPVLGGDHVTLDAGTGLVHTAPAHGPEDYLVGIDNNLDLSCQVDANGCYETSLHPEIGGKFVLNEGNLKIIDLLTERSDLLLVKEIEHSYPCDWRTKKPVLLRASKQWFIDAKSLQEKGLQCLRSIKIHPKFAESGFQGVLENRPYWCLSRQRVWGVPIPVFYDDVENVFVSREIIERCCQLIDTHGTDFWWKMTSSEILDGLNIPNYESLRKSEDILDVWLDSGITWHNVVREDLELTKTVADLYLEGLDQFSGWFYSSLLTSLALQDCPPYKQLYVHGFTMDDKGRKMSKSLGNVISPKNITKGVGSKKKDSKGTVYGVDVLRWWVAAHGSQSSAVVVGNHVLDQCKQDVDRIRNITKFLLGNLPTDMNDLMCLPCQDLLALDRLMLHNLQHFEATLEGQFDEFLYNKVCLQVNHFVANELSSKYIHLIKDRLYCDSKLSVERQSAITTLWHVLNSLRSVLSPIVPVMVAEMAEYNGSLTTVPTKLKRHEHWSDTHLSGKFEILAKLKYAVHENLRDSQDFRAMDAKEVEIFVDLSSCNKDIRDALAVFTRRSELSEYFQTSVEILTEEIRRDGLIPLCTTSEFSFYGRKTQHFSCPRCRLFVSKIENDLCQRCSNVVQSQI